MTKDTKRIILMTHNPYEHDEWVRERLLFSKFPDGYMPSIFELEEEEMGDRTIYVNDPLSGEPAMNDCIKNARIRNAVLDEAKTIINGERQGQYGQPENSFTYIAELWSAYSGKSYNAFDVAMFMALMKIARIKNGVYKNDNFVDLIGYAALAAELMAMNSGDEYDGK